MSCSNLLADSQVRRQLLADGESFHLEAPAGSGKTTQLVARFLTLLARVNHPAEILVLTFNRQAAGEVKIRLFDLLCQARNSPPPAANAEEELNLPALAYEAGKAHPPEVLLTPDSLPVMTFHSFCHQLVGQAPYEAGILPGVDLIEDEEQGWLQYQALELMRRRLVDQPAEHPVRQALVNRLLRLDNNWSRLARELHDLIGRRDLLTDFLELARLSKDSSKYQQVMQERLEFLVLQDLDALHAAFAATPLGKQWPDFWQHLRLAGAKAAARLPGQLPAPGLPGLADWQALADILLTKEGKPRKSWGPKSGFYTGFKNTNWAELIQALSPEAVDWLHRCRSWSLAAASPEEVTALHDLVLLIGQTIASYEQLCRERRAIDFIALEQAALRLFNTFEPSDIMLLWDYRLKHLLVDEFQDTSQNQHDLLCRIISGWQAGDGRSLFVVGDPKQSIYGWREARVQFFVQAAQGLRCPEQTPFLLESRLLTTNFRSTKALITWVNELFEKTVMANPDPSVDEVRFQAATPKPDAALGVLPELALFGVNAENNQPRQAEACWLAYQVKQRLSTLAEGDRIGILLFTRTHLRYYLEALQQAKVSVKVKEGLKLTDDPLVPYVVNLTRALVRPQDDLAWVGVLRSPWARQNLDDLAAIAREPAERWWDKLRRFAAGQKCGAKLQHLVRLLEQARQQVGRQPLAAIVTELLNRWPAWAGVARLAGAAGIANSRRYLELLAQAESGIPEVTLERMAFQLENAFQPADPQASRAPVEMMTVHAAKGLEFSQVFLPFLDWHPLGRVRREPPPFLLEQLPNSRVQALALAKPYHHERHHPLYERLWKLRQGRILAEARRLFYVAVTRAKQNLFLSAVVKVDPQGRLKAAPDTPWGWIQSHDRLSGREASKLPQNLPSGLTLYLDPVTAVSEGEPDTPARLPEPLQFQPEPVPYQMLSPSSLVRHWTPSSEPGVDYLEDNLVNKARGEVIHRLLAWLAQGEPLPDHNAVTASLRGLGLDEEPASLIAREILEEVAAAQQEPFLAYLLRSDHPQAWTEWALEDCPQPGLIRRGQIDRLIFEGGQWWLVDYKTSRPHAGEAVPEFLAREAEKYRPQLLAYQEMAAHTLGLANPGEIRLALYFTALRQKITL
ncbi:MAG: UvrD-helicase domain-containing protein [Deltaproteobacteria bacterium]|nr:UvrD-helicase domain-containing protein [Deltaproteobacteria bacterium]